MRFSDEPIIWIGAVIAVAMLVRDAITTGITLESLDAAGVAIGALIGRRLVSPVDDTKR